MDYKTIGMIIAGFFGIVIISGILVYNLDWKKIKSKKNSHDNTFLKDTLCFLEQYTYYGGYSSVERYMISFLDSIISRYKEMTNNNGIVNIESKFNNANYAVFDLDTQEHLDLFKTIYASTPYALFKSSTNHYWGIVDFPYDRIQQIYIDHNWKVCNDQKYVEFTRKHDRMTIRGLYENDQRKPHLYEIHGNLSQNFKLFIDKLCIYYNKEGLELSVLRYKDPILLIKFNRKRKLAQLKNI